MADPIAHLRRKPGFATETPEPPTGGEGGGYVAFNTRDKNERLKIRRANAPTRSPVYLALVDISYDGMFGTNFVLVYNFYMVFVCGKNLQSLIAALEMGTVEFIQEFDPSLWTRPTDPKAPIIDSIEIPIEKNGPVIAESENGAKRLH